MYERQPRGDEIADHDELRLCARQYLVRGGTRGFGARGLGV
jgi:hypothetical protein